MVGWLPSSPGFQSDSERALLGPSGPVAAMARLCSSLRRGLVRPLIKDVQRHGRCMLGQSLDLCGSRRQVSSVPSQRTLVRGDTGGVLLRGLVLSVRHQLRNALPFGGGSVHGIRLVLGKAFIIWPLGHLLVHVPASGRPLVEFPFHGVECGCRRSSEYFSGYLTGGGLGASPAELALGLSRFRLLLRHGRQNC